jgi:hypothetical protein
MCRFRHAAEMLRFVEEDVLADGGLRREELLPIAASPIDLDLFVMTRKSASQPGLVVRLAGAEIDRFPSFSEYVLAMVDYNRLELRICGARPVSPRVRAVGSHGRHRRGPLGCRRAGAGAYQSAVPRWIGYLLVMVGDGIHSEMRFSSPAHRPEQGSPAQQIGTSSSNGHGASVINRPP